MQSSDMPGHLLLFTFKNLSNISLAFFFLSTVENTDCMSDTLFGDYAVTKYINSLGYSEWQLEFP